MRNFLLTTTMAVGLGLSGPAIAQTQQPDASGSQAACQPGDPNCPASSGAAGGAAGQTTDGQAGDATQPPAASQAVAA